MLSWVQNREPEVQLSESVPFKNPAKIRSGSVQIFQKDFPACYV